MRNDSWREDAACRGLDTEMFFPGPGEPELINTAYRVCGRCPVKDECRAEAEKFDTRHGIWGGTSAYERTRVRNREPDEPPKPRTYRPPLTTVQREQVQALAALGWTNNEIARQVGVSYRSVARIRARYMQNGAAA